MFLDAAPTAGGAGTLFLDAEAAGGAGAGTLFSDAAPTAGGAGTLFLDLASAVGAATGGDGSVDFNTL